MILDIYKIPFIVMLLKSVLSLSDYDFEVISVERCPMTEEEWKDSSARLNCNDTFEYNCVPNKHLTSLIEFCYPGKKSLYQEGNCLELAAKGLFNHVPCKSTFSCGCPDTFYYSNEIYKFPMCLSINSMLRCFNADIGCISSRNLKSNTSEPQTTTSVEDQTTSIKGQTTIDVGSSEKDFMTTISNVAEVPNRNSERCLCPCSGYIAAVLFCVVFSIATIALVVFCFMKRKRRNERYKVAKPQDLEESEQLRLIAETSTASKERTVSVSPVHPNEETEQLQPQDEKDTATEDRTVVAHTAQENSHIVETEQLQAMDEKDTASEERAVHTVQENGGVKEKVNAKGSELPSLLLNLNDLECEHMVEDMELLLLLRRHCLHGAFENFYYLLKSRILNKKDDKVLSILESRDREGCSLLHYAAAGGSKDILEKLLAHCTKRKVDDVNHSGHTVLHIACKYDNVDICKFLLSDDGRIDLLLTKESRSKWNAAHFTAVCGKFSIFQYLHGKEKLDINCVTLNGLNILHIACIHNHTDFCQKLIERHEELGLSLETSDPRGWSVAHFAAKVGNKDIFQLFMHKKFTSFKTHHKKSILHICCEHGHFDLCKLIVEESPFIGGLLDDIDDEGWTALHSAAKGGNLEVFKLIERTLASTDPLECLVKETYNRKTVLHICCIHKHVEICKYICDKLKSTPHKINKVTRKYWTAAHYVAVEIKQDGTEEKLIKILVDAGIDLQAKSDEGKTVLTVAIEHRNKNLVDYLLDYHPKLVKIERAKLRDVAGFDNEIETKIENALQKLSSVKS
ncbi:uncharacterized protein LOC111108174 isoform X2 [Crassostrea virginica]